MPHFIVEYTANLSAEARIPELLKKGIEVLTAQGYPLAGMRAMGRRIDEFVLADDARDYVMVHAILKVAPGHAVEKKTRACQAIFDLLKAHFAAAFSGRYFMLSVEMVEIVSGDGPTLKYSNVRDVVRHRHKPEPRIFAAVGSGFSRSLETNPAKAGFHDPREAR